MQAVVESLGKLAGYVTHDVTQIPDLVLRNRELIHMNVHESLIGELPPYEEDDLPVEELADRKVRWVLTRIFYA